MVYDNDGVVDWCIVLVEMPLTRNRQIEHQFLSGIIVRESIHQCRLAKGLGIALLCWGFKGVQEEIMSEEASVAVKVRLGRPAQVRLVEQMSKESAEKTFFYCERFRAFCDYVGEVTAGINPKQLSST